MAQYSSGTVELKQVDFQYTGDNVVVSFDIANFSPNDRFYVIVEAYSTDKGKLNAKTFSGDLNNITGGADKKIVWNFKNDNVELDEKVYFKLHAKVVNQPNLGVALVKSAVFPGLGRYNYTKGKPHWMLGALAYGAIGGALYMNSMAAESRQNYENATTIEDADEFFSTMEKQNNLSYALAGAGALIWTVDLAGVVLKSKKEVPTEEIRQSQTYPTITATSSTKYLNTRAPIRPPMLSVAQTSIKLIDENGNNAIDADEKCTIEFLLENTGQGTAYDLLLQIEDKNNTNGLTFQQQNVIGDLEKTSQKKIVIPLNASMSLPNGTANFAIHIKETNGFDIDVNISVPTFEFAAPNVIVADYVFSTSAGGIAKAGVPINLKMIVQNIGKGTATNINLTLRIPENVFATNETYYEIGTLNAGQTKEIDFEFFANNRYTATTIPIDADLKESFGKYASNKTMNINLNTTLEETNSVVLQGITNNTEIEVVSLTAETDKNIPQCQKKYNNRYALIIGNEDYTKYQNDLRAEANVDFARNDAQVFAQYAELTLGIPKDNITLITDAIGSVMNREIERLVNKARYGDSNTELIFYYSGHGFPESNTKEGYIMPVDVSGANVTAGIKLSDLYQKLTEFPAKRVTVFLDACFSGGGRDQGLVAARTVRIPPVSNNITQGNLVVFSASSGDQESLMYDDKKHGIFTYCLLKKLQETEGNITYKELADYLAKEVAKIASDKLYKQQNPEVNISSDIENLWQSWKINW